MKMIRVAILQYRNALKSAVFGMAETLDMANEIANSLQNGVFASCHLIDNHLLLQDQQTQHFDLVLIPPATSSNLDASRLDRVRQQPEVVNWLHQQYSSGAILAAACLGVNFLAESRLLADKRATTHWGVADEMQNHFPDIHFDSDEIIVDNGRLITAGGLTAWLDLVLCLVAKLYDMATMSLLSKQLLVEPGHRHQQFFKQFMPNKHHGDETVLKLQDYIDEHLSEQISLEALCEVAFITERTLQRRFRQYFAMSPTEYMQRVRIQKACEQLELTQKSVNEIAGSAGYQEIQGFRKIFKRIIGLTPSEYRKQFSADYARRA